MVARRVLELYRSVTRKDPHMENKANPAGVHVFSLTKNMIGEIENRSSYVLAVTRLLLLTGASLPFSCSSSSGWSLLLLEHAGKIARRCGCSKNIADVEAFVNWLDLQLSSLVDERAVLKHFPQWPERKADILREAACNYRDLRNLKSEVSSFEDNMKEPLLLALRRIEALQDRLERSLSSTERTRDVTSKKYRDFQIPWEWMLDTGLIGQMKVSSLRLAKEFIKRLSKCRTYCSKESDLLSKCTR
ncbi:protein CHUP1, chloroplastic-like [Argentina anserina]|uniref:protein CHUP1, chloroplastic-like n=1 Tax=Argentina anserina TaxID=57926 RepID=UPI00217634D0|nr:protein CHUP1, chloroplastic-like [Potentilla anserina]